MLIANAMGAVADKIFIQAPDTFTPLVALDWELCI